MSVATQPAIAPSDRAGRLCPIDYTYSPAVFARAPDFEATTLYIAGGLYGNLAALEEIERMAAHEATPPIVVFNGDQHWFDAAPDWFAAIERGVSRHLCLRGNIETEIARADDIGAGCGCAYPETIGQDTVAYSNEIMELLRKRVPATARTGLLDLPMHLVACVGTLRVAIVHGDAAALAGWRFAHDALDNPWQRNWLEDVKRLSQVDLFASTHTCLPALREFPLSAGRLIVINNGSAGMPNFSGTRFGLISRVSTLPSPHMAIYGTAHEDVFIDALPVAYDSVGFLDRFLTCWPAGSPAHASYYRRIVNGPEYELAQSISPIGP